MEVVVPSRPGYERVAMECAASLAKMAGMDVGRVEDLKTAVGEACLNAMEHGNRWRTETRVEVSLELGDDSLMVLVRDAGTGILEEPPAPSFDRQLEGLDSAQGWGLFLIRKLADEVDFSADRGEGHVFRMRFRLGDIPAGLDHRGGGCHAAAQ